MRTHAVPTRPLAGSAALVLALALGLVPYGEAQASNGLTPHRAAYSITRGHADRAANIAAIRGRLELNFEGSCDGWRFQQHIGLQIFDLDGQQSEHLSSLDGWETRDATEYWFNLRGYADREQIEHFAGAARIVDGAGDARFAQPTPKTFALDPATLFPVAHISALVEAARAGRRQHLARVFDGTASGAGFEVSAVIGAPVDAPALAASALPGHVAWPIRLAFFPVGELGAEPDFEMSITLLDNGVAAALVYDYGDFSMDLALESVDVEAVPAC